MSFSRAKTQLSRPNFFFQKNLQNDENVFLEYKEVSFHQKKDTPQKRIKVTSRATEESKIKLEIANLHDEINRLKQTLEEKMKRFSNLELATIFYLNSNTKTLPDVIQITSLSKQLDSSRNILTDLYDSDSINRLQKSNYQEQLLNDQLKTKLAVMKKEIESKQKQIYVIRNSYEPGKINKQKNKIQKMRQKIHIAVEDYRKLKREKEALSIDQSNINDLERILIDKKEKLKQKKLQYNILGNKQKQEITAMKLKKEQLSRHIAVSEALHAIEVKQKPETINNHKNYIQENDLLIDDNFQIAFKNEQQCDDDQVHNIKARKGFEANEKERLSVIQTDSFLESTSIAYSESYFSSEKLSKNPNISYNIVKSNLHRLHQNEFDTESKSYHSTTESTTISETSEKLQSNATRKSHKYKPLSVTDRIEIKGNKSNFKPYELLSEHENSEYEMNFNNNYSTTIEESLDATDYANKSSQKDEAFYENTISQQDEINKISQLDDARLSSSSDSLSLY